MLSVRDAIPQCRVTRTGGTEVEASDVAERVAGVERVLVGGQVDAIERVLAYAHTGHVSSVTQQPSRASCRTRLHVEDGPPLRLGVVYSQLRMHVRSVHIS